jgi:hypothetical protein
MSRYAIGSAAQARCSVQQRSGLRSSGSSSGSSSAIGVLPQRGQQAAAACDCRAYSGSGVLPGHGLAALAPVARAFGDAAAHQRGLLMPCVPLSSAVSFAWQQRTAARCLSQTGGIAPLSSAAAQDRGGGPLEPELESPAASPSPSPSSQQQQQQQQDRAQPSLYSPLHYDILEFAARIVPTPAERAEKQRIIQRCEHFGCDQRQRCCCCYWNRAVQGSGKRLCPLFAAPPAFSTPRTP